MWRRLLIRLLWGKVVLIGSFRVGRLLVVLLLWFRFKCVWWLRRWGRLRRVGVSGLGRGLVLYTFPLTGLVERLGYRLTWWGLRWLLCSGWSVSGYVDGGSSVGCARLPGTVCCFPGAS